MTTQYRAETAAEAEARIAPYLARFKALVHERHPTAAFRFGPGPESGTWLLWAHLPVKDDLDLEQTLAEHSTDLLVDQGVALSVITVPAAA
jgi:hypothetical protein